MSREDVPIILAVACTIALATANLSEPLFESLVLTGLVSRRNISALWLLRAAFVMLGFTLLDYLPQTNEI